jgi:hypothetical protein
MIASDILETPATTPSGVASGRSLAGTPDDKDMLRAAVDLTRDIDGAARNLLARHAGFGRAGLCRAGGRDPAGQPWAALACGVLAALALYRALLFIHELTHIHKNALPGFRLVWNLLVGIPMLTPSFMYEGVHTLHHARTRYGTAEDPEYLPLALMKPWSLPVFLISAILLPLALLIRSGVLVPLGVVIRRCARWCGNAPRRWRSTPRSAAARPKAISRGWCSGRNWARPPGPSSCSAGRPRTAGGRWRSAWR